MRQNQKRIHTNRGRRFPLPLLIVVGALIVGSLGLGGWKLASRNDAPADDNKKTTQKEKPRTSSGIDMNPATEEDKKANEEHKDRLVEQEQNPPEQSDTVTPIITILGQYGNDVEVSAYVSGVIEDGGTCTMTATMGSKKVIKETKGIQNAQNTTCPTFIAPRSEFSPGSWSVTVNYASASHSGTSQAKTLEVK